MGMDTAAGTLLKGGEEERRTCGRFQSEGFADILAIGGGVFRSWELKDEDVMRLDQFFLDTGRGYKDMVSSAD